MEEVEEKKIVNVSPISKGKRVLVFLADFFLMFIATFLIFNALVMPLSNLIIKSNERSERNDNAAAIQFKILYGQKVMLHEGDSDLYDYDANVQYTMNCFLSYYSFSEGDVLEEHKQYGYKEENEVLRHFYRDIRSDYSKYITILQSVDSDYKYFVIEEENNGLHLIDEAKTNVKLSFFSPNDMSESGKTILSNLQSEFMNIYAEVFKDIEANDLTFNGESYVVNKAIVAECESSLQWQLVISSFVAYLISIAIYYIVIPLFIPDGRTLALLMMKVTRIGTNNLFLLKKTENILNAVYMIAFNLPVVFFMPMTIVTFTYLFTIPVLLPALIIGILLTLVSLIIIIISSYNRTLCDYLSRSVIIKNDDLDEIYRSKGYDI